MAPLSIAFVLSAWAAGASPTAPLAGKGQVEVELVLVPVVVLADGRPLRGLPREAFRLYVDGQPLAFDHFEPGHAPISAAIVIDASASMIGRRLALAVAAARNLIDRLGPGDRALVLAFDHRVQLLCPLTADRDALGAALDRLASGGGTAIYDALARAIDELEPVPGRKALVLLTDGEDATSKAFPARVERAARRSQVLPYVLRLGGGGAGRLDELAADLGGASWTLGTADALRQSYDALFDELRAQYTLGFTPPRPADGRWHPIRVEVDQPRVRVRARRGWLHAR